MVSVDDLDWQVIDALRVNPRASWTLVGNVLGIDAGTVSRRWQRMAADGLAWVSAYPGPLGFPAMARANVEITCEAGNTPGVAAALAEHPYAFSVEQTAGNRDLYVSAVAPGFKALTHYLAEEVETIPGVLSARSSIVTGVVSDGSGWRGGTLSPEQERQLRPPTPAGGTEPLVPHPLDYRILTALGRDGRMSFNDLAEHCEVSPSTIRRRLSVLVDHRAVTFRTDLTRPLTNGKTAAVFFAEVPAGQLHEVGRRVAALPGVRAAYCQAGPCNLMVFVWVRLAGGVRKFEVLLDSQNLALRVVDRSIVLRSFKYAGHILDDTGRSVRCIGYPYVPNTEQRRHRA